jgi:alkanesulfonate monooxygenase SsuD/methylene tetrahydromethanopterin reductase-like flavin-dependent oxidoreductase (luciferase family)
MLRFTHAEAMTDPTFYVPLARAAEAAGYTSMTVPDSIAYPFESDSAYPCTPDGSREFLDW